MSLIEEALRRVQQSSTSQQPPKSKIQESMPVAHSWPTVPPVTPFPPTAQQRPVEHPSSVAMIGLMVLGGLAVALLWGRWWVGHPIARMAPTASRGVQKAVSRVVISRSPQPPIATEVTPANGSESNMILSGVVVGIGAPYAVINGQIVGIGERVGEATLLEITQNSVTLQATDGTTRVLKVPQ